MNRVIVFCAIVLLVVVLWDAFETVVLPRRVTRRFRLVGLFYRTTWPVWSQAVRFLVPGRSRETALSYYGPLSMILLLAVWAGVLIFAFGLLYFMDSTALSSRGAPASLGTAVYFSGTTFFTLGLGDVSPSSSPARALVAVEAGLGFGFLAIVISYLPAIHQSFARREVNISLLDSRAGSPPSASEILRRQLTDKSLRTLTALLYDWERWCAELLESHLSFPMLAYFRSQHDNQSWLGALTAMLDTCAFVIADLEGECTRQARLTFAMARHTIVDLALVLHAHPKTDVRRRLGPAQLTELRRVVRSAGLAVRATEESDRTAVSLHDLYEPFVHALAARLRMNLPPVVRERRAPDNWEVSAWGAASGEDEHF